MNMRFRSTDPAAGGRTPLPLVRVAVGLWLLALSAGCQQLAVLTHLMGPKQKIPAEYRLPAGPVLVLVDDQQDLMASPEARRELVDALATELRAHDAVDRVTTNEEIATIRKSTEDFEQRGVREVGQIAGADTVIWLSMKQFDVERDLEMVTQQAQAAATLKVINSKAEERSEVRLWPKEREGRMIGATVTPHELRACRTLPEMYRKVAGALAGEVAKLFYDQELER